MVSNQADRSVADVLVSLMEEAGVTQTLLAEQTGIPLSTLNRHLRTGQSFKIWQVAAIAPVLGTTLSDIFVRADQAA